VIPSHKRTLVELAKRSHFKVSEAAVLFGVHIQTVHFWLKNRKIRHVERTSSGGTYLIPRSEVVRLLAESGSEVAGLWSRPRARVLLIDDDPGIRRLALAAARAPKMPMRLKVAQSVEDGLLLAAMFKPEVILLDTSFPKDKMRGDQGLAFIRGTKLLRNVRVVAMVDHPDVGAGMLRGGADAFLQKPFGLSDFRDVIELMRSKGRVAPRVSQAPKPVPAP
jgi:excisionase family DNA binding protein